MENSRRTWIVVIIVVILIIFLLRMPAVGKFSVAGVSWNSIDQWFKSVTGLSLTQIALALWRLFLWAAKFILNVLWAIAAWVIHLVSK